MPKFLFDEKTREEELIIINRFSANMGLNGMTYLQTRLRSFMKDIKLKFRKAGFWLPVGYTRTMLVDVSKAQSN